MKEPNMTITKKIVFASLLFVGISTFGQSTNPPVIKATKPSSDSPVILNWTSEAPAIYTVYYSTNLTNWSVAVDNLPSQGTNTLWADYGVEMNDDSRPASTDPDAPFRFYKVLIQGYSSNVSSITVVVSNINNGAILSGVTNVVTSASTNENILANYLYVDGYPVGDRGAPFSGTLPIDTRNFANGTHRLSVSYENDGDAGTTGGDDPITDLGAGYGVTNITVTFSNFLSNFRARYTAFRPDLGQTEQVYATWATPRSWKVSFTPFNDLNNEIRWFTNCGTHVVVNWDGLDTNGAPVDPQLLAVNIYDLGACTPAPPSGGGGGGSPPSLDLMSRASASDESSSVGWFPKSEEAAIAAGLTSYFVEPPPMPPVDVESNGVSVTVSWEEAYGPIPWTEMPVSTDQQELSETLINSAQSFGFGPDTPGVDGDPVTIPVFINKIGSFLIAFQGHHPLFSPSNRPDRGLPFGQATMSTSSAPPWGHLRSPYRIARDLSALFPRMGYQNAGYIHKDDALTATEMKKSSLSGSHVFDTANIGLFIGHSAGEKETITALGHNQTYIPIYDSVAGTITWIGMNDMRWGSSDLKWMAFYSCNIFRDSPRNFPCYSAMKNASHLAMGNQLHIMQGYLTEATIHPDFAAYWTYALSGKTSVAANHTVIGAWKYVCRRTQPKINKDPDQNICRSIFWPECEGDYVYGYGSQTDPSGGHIQGELQEADGTANDSEP